MVKLIITRDRTKRQRQNTHGDIDCAKRGFKNFGFDTDVSFMSATFRKTGKTVTFDIANTSVSLNYYCLRRKTVSSNISLIYV